MTEQEKKDFEALVAENSIPTTTTRKGEKNKMKKQERTETPTPKNLQELFISDYVELRKTYKKALDRIEDLKELKRMNEKLIDNLSLLLDNLIGGLGLKFVDKDRSTFPKGYLSCEHINLYDDAKGYDELLKYVQMRKDEKDVLSPEACEKLWGALFGKEEK